MSRSIQDIPKKRGRPKTTGRMEGVMVRLSPEVLALLDAQIKARPAAKLTRPSIIRAFVEAALGIEAPPKKKSTGSAD